MELLVLSAVQDSAIPHWLTEIVSELGVVGILLIILWGLRQRWWVMGWQYEDLVEDRDEWKDMALNAMTVAGKATSTAETSVTIAERKH